MYVDPNAAEHAPSKLPDGCETASRLRRVGMDHSKVADVNDMVALPNLSVRWRCGYFLYSRLRWSTVVMRCATYQEALILHTLRERYKAKKIYVKSQCYALCVRQHDNSSLVFAQTYTSSTLCSINPYESLPLYGGAVMQQYCEALQSGIHDKIAALPPHLYTVAHRAYVALLTNFNSQCVIIRYTESVDTS